MPASAALFDHESDAPLRGRRRPAPDWGGDDLFDHVPRRRFAPAEAPVDALADEARDDAPAPLAEVHELRPAPVRELVAARHAEYVAGPSAPAGRRTVTITGHPGRSAQVARAARSRPPRSLEERIHARPDRLAAWAFALALLLIVVALATSG